MLSFENRKQHRTTDGLQLVVQGRQVNYCGAHDVASLLASQGENIAYVNVRINGQVLDRRDFENIPLRDSDRVDFLYYMGGGAA